MGDNNLFSIDRLVEFGMGMAIAQQMVKTMNESFTNMSIPGASNPVEKPEQKLFYAVINNQQTGPFLEQELARLISEKKISKETYMWTPGLPDWEIAQKIPEVLKLVALSPPPFQKHP